MAIWLTLVGALLFPLEQQTDILQKGNRVIFLGDSNTYAATYVDLLDAYFRVHHPELELDLINVGLPSETASGLSEPDHPYPRPTVHERLDRVLEKTKPDVVFICYGMNDGIYHPFSKERFEAYQKGLLEVVEKAKKAGAKVVLMTPPPFDPEPMRKTGKLRKADADQFAYFAIFEGYDEVLTKYAEWVMTQKDQTDCVIDLHTPFNKALAEKRKSNPDYTMSGDGVHFNADGHRILATQVLKSLGYKPDLDMDGELFKLVGQRQHLLRDAWLTYCGHKRPDTAQGKPLDQAQKEAAELQAKIQKLVDKK